MPSRASLLAARIGVTPFIDNDAVGSMNDENAYALLTNIQGFDSFSLGPHSSLEEIARAFQTQVRVPSSAISTQHHIPQRL